MANHEATDVPLDWTMPVAQVPASGKRIAREATGEECAAFANAAGVDACEHLSADLLVEPLAGGTYRVSGRARARITQACVVTLDPVAARLDEPVLADFRPEGDLAVAGRHEVDLDDEADLEPIENGALAIGRLVYECLASAIDPYPRTPDASLKSSGPADVHGEQHKTNPFAVLARLKDKPTGKTG